MAETEISAPVPENGEAGTAGRVWILVFTRFVFGAGMALTLVALVGLLAPALGATHAARAPILAALLSGLWAGTRILSGREGRSAAFLLAPAVYLLLGPWLFPVLAPLSGSAWIIVHAFPPLLFLVRFALALLAVALPTVCLGASLAALCASPAGLPTEARPRALQLALPAAGAAFALVNAAFWLLPWKGYALVSAAAAAALLGVALLWRFFWASESSVPVTESTQAEEMVTKSPLLRSASFACGFAALSALFGWERLLVLVYGPFPETAPLMISLFLGGMALGSAMLVLWPPRSGSRFPWPPAVLGLAGLATAATVFRADRLPLLYLSVAPLAATSPFRFALGSWGIAAELILPAAIAWGALLPLCFEPGGAPSSGLVVGGRGLPTRLGGVRDFLFGSVVAVCLAPLAIIPRLGFRSTLQASAVILSAVSVGGFALARRAPRLVRLSGLLVGMAVPAAFCLLPPPGDPRLLTSGVHRYSAEILDQYKTPEAYRAARLKAGLSFYREGGEATVGVERVEEPEGGPVLALSQDGSVVATTFMDLIPQILAAEIPLLVRPSARDLLFIGYGSGIGAGSALLHPVSTLEVIEPEMGLVEGSRQFEPANRTPRRDPRLTFEAEDPRQVLQGRARGSYDLILSRASAPESVAARGLTTAGFYRIAASRLRPGGIFAQALPLRGLDAADVASVIRTIRTAFADAVLLQTYYEEALVLASQETIRFDPEAMQRAMEEGKISSDLGRIGIPDPEGILVRHRLSGKGLNAFLGEGSILTDAGPGPRWVGYRPGSAPVAEPTLEAIDRFSKGLADRIAGLAAGAPGNARLLRIARAALGMGDAVRAADLAETLLARGDPADGHQVLGDAHYLRREQIAAVKEWHKALDADPKHVNALLSLADYQSDRQSYETAEAYLRRAVESDPGDPAVRYFHGRALYYLGRYPESEADLLKTLEAKGEAGAPLALYYLGMIQKGKKNLEAAAELLRRYLQWAYTQPRLTPVEADVHLSLAEIYAAMRLPDLAAEQQKAGEELVKRLRSAGKGKERALLNLLRKP